MQLIGKGAFSKVYLQPNQKKVTIKSCCPVKAFFAEDIFVPSSSLFPKIKKVGYEEYEMKYLPRPQSLKQSLTPLHWEYYKLLRNIAWASDWENRLAYLPKKLGIPIMDCVYRLYNYTHELGFEISPRNVTVHKGKLILLDVFFCRTTLRKVRRY